MGWKFMKSCPMWHLCVISRSSISVINKKYHWSCFFIWFDLYGDKTFFPVAIQILMFFRTNKWVLMTNTCIEILVFYWEMDGTLFECKIKTSPKLYNHYHWRMSTLSTSVTVCDWMINGIQTLPSDINELDCLVLL